MTNFQVEGINFFNLDILCNLIVYGGSMKYQVFQGT